MEFAVMVNMLDGYSYFFSRVYAIDKDKNMFLLADYSGRFVWIPIEQCVLTSYEGDS